MGEIMRADRLLSIMLLLQTRGKLTADTLAKELDVSRRTILRDIDALSLAGIPIYAEGGHGGGIALDEQYRTTLTGLQKTEALTLFISGNATRLSELGLQDAAENTLLKLLAALPASYKPSVDHIRQRILIDPDWWWQEAQPHPNWELLQQAVYEDRHIQTNYENYHGEIVERILAPYSLVAKSSLWYLVAEREGELRTYRVSRFHQVTLLDTHFQRQANYDLSTYWRGHVQNFPEQLSEYRLTLRFPESRMSFVTRLVPGRSAVVETSGDSGWVTARFHLESIELAKMLVFGIGAEVEIIEPDELRQAVLATVGSFQQMFTDSRAE